MSRGKLRLAVAAALFVGWLGWLGYTAANKYRGPVVSKSQAAAATLAVVAKVPAGDGPRVVELTDVLHGPMPEGPVTVSNIGDSIGFDGPGEYLLLLARGRGDTFAVVGPLRTPGYDQAGAPTVYPWTPAVCAQAAERFR
jgi:hypothetical protein